jgi:integrase/recombinase XerD
VNWVAIAGDLQRWRGLGKWVGIVELVPGRKLPMTLTSDEITALMGRPNLDAPTGLRNRCMLELMYRCGLRNSEGCGIHLRDVDWKAAELRIRPEVAKGGREAVLPLEASALELLERWKPVRRRYANGNASLFVTLTGGPVDRHYVWEMTSRYGRRAGIDRPIWPHMLRHTFGTELLREGFDLREVQTLMRHADIRTTVLYTHLVDVELAAKVRARR